MTGFVHQATCPQASINPHPMPLYVSNTTSRVARQDQYKREGSWDLVELFLIHYALRTGPNIPIHRRDRPVAVCLVAF